MQGAPRRNGAEVVDFHGILTRVTSEWKSTVILNHSTPTQMLTYMGRMADDVTKAYGNAI